jgi:hypothetical protein
VLQGVGHPQSAAYTAHKDLVPWCDRTEDEFAACKSELRKKLRPKKIPRLQLNVAERDDAREASTAVICSSSSSAFFAPHGGQR